ncbi:MAG: DUF5518 domain-containing protein, partial [Methanobacteriaceae archaeon]|nr:DUF5518 domain-containing protein [Methanobacteriaceae archaeon]
MVEWGAVIVGFFLSLIFPGLAGTVFPGYGNILGLLLAGFVVGIMVGDGAFNGFWNASVAGAFGGIVAAILITLFGTAFAGLAGLA